MRWNFYFQFFLKKKYFYYTYIILILKIKFISRAVYGLSQVGFVPNSDLTWMTRVGENMTQNWLELSDRIFWFEPHRFRVVLGQSRVLSPRPKSGRIWLWKFHLRPLKPWGRLVFENELIEGPMYINDFVLIRECLIVNGVTHIIKYDGVELILLSLSLHKQTCYSSKVSPNGTPLQPSYSTNQLEIALFHVHTCSI